MINVYPQAFQEELNNGRLTLEEFNHLQTKLAYSTGAIVSQSSDYLEAINQIKFILQSFPYEVVKTTFHRYSDMLSLLYAPISDFKVDEVSRLTPYYEQKKSEIEDKRNQQFDVENVGDPCKKCGNTNTVRKTIQIQSSDEPLKTFDECKVCNKTVRV